MAIIRREELDVASLISSAIESGKVRSCDRKRRKVRPSVDSNIGVLFDGRLDWPPKPYELLSASNHAKTYKKRKRKRSAT